MIYSFPVTVTEVFERKLRKHVKGAGPAAIFRSESKGWYIQLNEMISIFVGEEKPDFEAGQIIILTLRKVVT